MCPTLSAPWTWLQAHEQSLAIWLEGLALVAIFGLELKEHKRQGRERKEQHEESAAQMAIMQSQADAIRDNAIAAKANAEALINSERAWVLVDIGKLPPFDPDPNQVQILWIFPRIKNHGKAVARIKRVAGIVKLIPEGEKLPVVPEYILGQGFNEQIDIVLPPEVPIQPRLGISGDEWIKVQRGRFSLFVHGFVEYFDGVSEQQRRSAYCFGYVIQGGFSPAESGFYPYLEAPRAYTECT